MRAFEVLDFADTPELYLTADPIANAYTVGAERPIVAVHSGLVDLLDDTALAAVLAHEAAHIHCDHSLFRSALNIVVVISRALAAGAACRTSARRHLERWVTRELAA